MKQSNQTVNGRQSNWWQRKRWQKLKRAMVTFEMTGPVEQRGGKWADLSVIKRGKGKGMLLFISHVHTFAYICIHAWDFIFISELEEYKMHDTNKQRGKQRGGRLLTKAGEQHMSFNWSGNNTEMKLTTRNVMWSEPLWISNVKKRVAWMQKYTEWVWFEIVRTGGKA